MHLTFVGLIPSIADPTAPVFLHGMACEHSKVKRMLHAAVAAGLYNPGQFKKDFSEAHGLTSRQFNAMALEVRAAIDGVRESLKESVLQLEAKLKTLTRATADLERMVKSGLDAKGRKFGKARLEKKKRNLHEKKRGIGCLEHKIEALQARIKKADPGICFGSRKLFLEQFEEGVDHAAWKEKFDAARNSQFFMVGARDEDNGCAGCQGRMEADGPATFRIRPFTSMLAPREPKAPKLGKDGKPKPAKEMKRRKVICARPDDFVVLRGVRFDYGHSYVAEVLARNAVAAEADRTPLTFRFVQGEDTRWRLHLSMEVAGKAVFDVSGGAVGVDFNQDHIAATVVDRDGNFVCCRRFPLDLYGVGKLQARDLIRCAARDVSLWAKELGLPLVAEDLDFRKKKRSMAAFSGKRRRQLSSLHFSAWGQALTSRCLRDGVALRLVDPAFSSVIGRVKFSASLGLSVHHAAAMAIARRGMELAERLPKSSVMIPDGKGAHVTLDRVEANIGRRHVRGAWAKVAKAIKAALAAQPLGRESGTSPGKLKEAEQDLDDIISGRRISTTVTTASPTGVMSPGFSGEIPGRRPVFPDEGRVSPYTGSLPS